MQSVYTAIMQVPGFLRLTTLGDVLGAIYREGATGVLEIAELHGVRAGKVHRVHVHSGLVVNVEAEFPGTRLGDVLVQSGLTSPDRVRQGVARLPSLPGMRFGDVLLSSRTVSEHALSEALRLQRRERLERLFELEDARLTFRVARRPSANEALEPSAVLKGRKRHRDRLSSIPSSRRQDPARARALSVLGLDGAADRPSVQKAFRELARSSHPDRFPTASVEQRAYLMQRFAEITAAYHALVA
jgi:hypothetical protein